jgi:hypothetical protein
VLQVRPGILLRLQVQLKHFLVEQNPIIRPGNPISQLLLFPPQFFLHNSKIGLGNPELMNTPAPRI